MTPIPREHPPLIFNRNIATQHPVLEVRCSLTRRCRQPVRTATFWLYHKKHQARAEKAKNKASRNEASGESKSTSKGKAKSHEYVAYGFARNSSRRSATVKPPGQRQQTKQAKSSIRSSVTGSTERQKNPRFVSTSCTSSRCAASTASLSRTSALRLVRGRRG